MPPSNTQLPKPMAETAALPEKVQECLEQCGLSPDELCRQFGPEVAVVVALKIEGRSEEQIAAKGLPSGPVHQSTVSRMLTSRGIRLEPQAGIPSKIHLPAWGDRQAVTKRLNMSRRSRGQPTLPGFEGVDEPEEPDIQPPPNDWRDAVKRAREDRDEERGNIEDAAINAVESLYRVQGYRVTSVETRNLGWDLEFRKGGGSALLRVEVKGKKCAEWSEIQVELTRNEREQSENPGHRDSYRLAIVRDALGKNPKCAIYTRDGDGWKRADDFAGDDGDAPNRLTMSPADGFTVQGRW